MRFRWLRAGPVAQVWYVVDTEAPDREPGQLQVFGQFPTKEAAVMTCMSLNGQQVAPS